MNQTPPEPTNEGHLLYILGIAVFAVAFWAYNMRHALKEKKVLGVMPFLMIYIDKSLTGLYIKNVGSTIARSIVIKDIKVFIKSDLNKEIRMKISPIELLEPRKKMAANFRIFEAESEIFLTPEQLASYLIDATFKAQMECTNLEGVRFSSVLIKDLDKFYIKETVPLDSNNAPSSYESYRK